MNDFSKKTLRSLARKGIKITGLTVLPDHSKDMPFACGDRGYIVDDNGTGKVWNFTQVLDRAG